MNRTATIRTIPYAGFGAEGPDTVRVVDFYENGVKKNTFEYPEKSIHFVESVVENWCAGILNEV